MSFLTNIARFGFTEEDIKDMIGRLDPKNKKDRDLIVKLIKLGTYIKRSNNK